MAEALVSNMQIGYIHSNIRASASAPVLRCCKVNIMITGYGCILHILITGEVINQGDCKSTEAVFRVYRPQVAKVYMHKTVKFCWSCICICIYDVGEEEAGTLIRWWWDYMESKHPSDAANLRPALPARSFVFVFHISPRCISVFVHIFDFTWIASGYVSDCESEGNASQLQLLLTGS